MPIQYPISVANPPLVAGDAVVAIFNALAVPPQWEVQRANAASLAVMPTVLGVWDGTIPVPIPPPGQANILINGDALPPGIGLGPGAATLVAVDPNAAPGTPNLIRVARPDGSEFIVGTSDQAGGVTVQPRASRDTSSMATFNVVAYGAIADYGVAFPPTDNTPFIQAAIDAAYTPGGPGNQPTPGARVEIPAGPPDAAGNPTPYFCARNIYVRRQIHLTGWSVGEGLASLGGGSTPIVFAPGMGFIVDRAATSFTGGAGDGSVIENIDIKTDPVPNVAPFTSPVIARPDLDGQAVPRGLWVNTVDDDRSLVDANGNLRVPVDENRFFFEALTDGLVAPAPPAPRALNTTPIGLPQFISVEREILSSTNVLGAPVVITTTNDGTNPGPHLLEVLDAVYISNCTNSSLPDGPYVVSATPTPSTFEVGVLGDGVQPGGHDGVVNDSVIQDGPVVWAVRSNAGIILKAEALVRKVYVDGYMNAGVLVATPFGVNPLHPASASRFHLEDVTASNCGIGFAIYGGDSNVGVGVNCNVLAPGQNVFLPKGPGTLGYLPADPRSTGGHGIDDFSDLGCTWINSHVNGVDGGPFTGYCYRRVGANLGPTNGGSTFVGCYQEVNMLPAHVNYPSVVIAGTVVMHRMSTALVLSPGQTRNVEWRGIEHGAVGSGELAFGTIEKPQQESDGSGPAVYEFSHTDDNPGGGVAFMYKYHTAQMQEPRAGEWEFSYGSLSTSRALIGYLGQSALFPEGGKGNWRDAHGHFLGKGSEEHFFLGPKSALDDPWIRGGGSPSGAAGLEQYRVGDQIWFPGVQGNPQRDGRVGSCQAWIVSRAGYRGTPWAAIVYGEANAGRAADLVQPAGTGGDEPPDTTPVYRAVGEGLSGGDPSLLPFVNVGETRPDVNYDPTPPVNNTLQWTWVGHVPTYNRIGKIRAPAEDRTTMEPRVTTLDDTAVQIGSFTTVLDSVVTITLTISGCEPDIGPQSAGLVRVATFRNVGGVVTQVAPGTVELCTVRDDPAWDAFFDVSGTDVRFWVQNANVGNATPVFWTGSAVPVETIAPAVR